MLGKLLRYFKASGGQQAADSSAGLNSPGAEVRRKAGRQALRKNRYVTGYSGAYKSDNKLKRQNYAQAGLSGVRIFYFFLFAMLFLALYLSYLLVIPFLHTIILACIFSALSHPLYRKILNFLGGRPWIASGVTLFLLVVVVCIPLVFFILQLIPQATGSITRLSQWLGSSQMDEVVQGTVSPALEWLNKEFAWFSLDIEDVRNNILNLSRQAGQLILSWGTAVVVDSLNMAANFFLMLLMMFFLLKDGEGMIETLKALTPLREEQEDNIIYNLRRMSKAVLMGGFLVAGIQGFVGGIGLALVGMPALFLGTLMAFAALVPILGTALVWAPVVLFLWISGHGSSAVVLFLWCGILVTSVDSFLRPVLIRGKAKTSLLFLFMSVVGGIKAFGALGIVYGPLILSFVGVMLGIYFDEYSASLDSYHAISKKKQLKSGRSLS